MPLSNIFTATTHGSMAFIGNTLGLSGPRSDGQQVGTIRVFTTLDPLQQVSGYPVGTTTTWQNNQSNAILTLPSGSTILYAELQWGGTSISALDGNVSALMTSSITFVTPSGPNTIVPDSSLLQIFSFDNGSGINEFYSLHFDATTIVQAAGDGTYSVSGVPAVSGADANAINAAGWTLGVIYSNPSLPFRTMSLYCGLQAILASTTDISISGFLAPSTGTVQGRILVAAMEGDSGIPGDQMLFGPTTSNLSLLSGPNNLSTNFFSSQINDGSSESPTVGQLNTTGTFGTLNSIPNVFPPQGVRQGWDITNISAANFVNNQTSAVVRITTSGDAYGVPILGIQFDSVEFDFGDAPDTGSGNGPGNYSTLLSNNGPRHGIQNQLFLGTVVTPETDARQNSTATGDDIPAGIQDDAAVTPLPVLSTVSSNYTLTITLTNNTGSTAKIYSWLDFNQDGIFQTNEGFTTTIPSLAGTQNIPLLFARPSGSVSTSGNTFLRIRITTDTLVNTGTLTTEDTRSLGLALDGEVEDYEVLVNAPPICPLPIANYTNQNTEVTGTINATDPEGLPITYSISVPPSNGVANINSTSGLYSYTPNTGFLGTDTFTVTATDSTGETCTTDITIYVNQAIITISKSQSKSFVDLNSTLIYTLIVNNIGNVTATNVIITDTLPDSVTYMPGTLFVNGVPSVENPNTGINLNNVLVGLPETITFSVTIDTIPSNGEISNFATSTFNFTVDPSSPNSDSGTATSNIVTSTVKTAILASTKSVDKPYATIGDELTYTITLQNYGNITALNILVTDTIPFGTTFVADSVTLNGFSQIGINPEIGIPVPSISIGSSSTITFKVKVI